MESGRSSPDHGRCADENQQQHSGHRGFKRWDRGWRNFCLAASTGGQSPGDGQDAALDAVQRVVDGKQTMTIYKPIRPLAFSAVDSALKLARGETIDAKDKVNNGKLDVPSILQQPIVVDKDNVMQTVIKDGYHKMEDVYKNVPRDQWPKQ